MIGKQEFDFCEGCDHILVCEVMGRGPSIAYSTEHVLKHTKEEMKNTQELCWKFRSLERNKYTNLEILIEDNRQE